MLSYFCEGRTTEFCKVINASAENYRFLDIIIILFLLSLLAYSCINLVKKLNELDVRNYSTARLLKLAIGKIGWLYLIGITVCFIYAIFMYLATFYSKHVGYGFSTDPAVWGQAGDFFGGMLNPFLAFCSFMALLYTIKIQTEELRDTRREAKKSADALAGQLDILKVQKFYDIFYRLLSDFQSFSFKDKRRSHSDYSDLMRAYGRFYHKPDFNELMFIRNDICNMNGVSDSVGEICGDIFLFVENADVLEQDKIFCFRRLQLAMSEELSFLIGLYFNKIIAQKSHDGYVDKVISIIKKRKLINNGCFDNSPGGLFFALNTFSGGGVLLNQLGYDADDIGVTIVEWSDWVESDNCEQ